MTTENEMSRKAKEAFTAGDCAGRIRIFLDPASMRVDLTAWGERWTWDKSYEPGFYKGETYISFSSAARIRHEEVQNGIGAGVRSCFSGFEKAPGFSFETYVWIEECTGNVFFEWIPLTEEEGIREVCWPGPMEFIRPEKGRAAEDSAETKCRASKASADEAGGLTDAWYTLVNEGQGLLIPADWPVASRPLHFDGMFLTAGSYMPWFGQVKDKAGYIAIALTPWNGRITLEHPAGGPCTRAAVSWQPSLGKMESRRILRYTFLENCSYNDLCRIYRDYVMENGLACTLREKEARLPSVRKLYGAAFVHTGIKTHVDPSSDFYDPQNPEKANSLISFAFRKEEMEKLHRMGVEKLYLHLDGWADPGYDNLHPDYLPACREAGGWEGMKELADTVRKLGYLFGIHDQYRDYYRKAPSFSEEYACRAADGTIPGHARWAGGPQTYLCATQAPFYVRRNFSELKKHGIRLDGAYLDVFTCNEGDECSNPRHRMTRRECYEFRGKCFDYLISQGILPSSEEVSDWSMRSLVFCHYAPYSFQLGAPDAPRTGIPVPLFSLVYHDCVVVPWMMERMSDSEDYMLYALLNGGAPYLIRDAAYPGIDGAFAPETGMTLEEAADRSRVVSRLHEKVADQQMLRHEFLDGDPQRQRSTFADGTQVEIDLRAGTYNISEGSRPDCG